jgi:hypothetical protein
MDQSGSLIEMRLKIHQKQWTVLLMLLAALDLQPRCLILQ